MYLKQKERKDERENTKKEGEGEIKLPRTWLLEKALKVN